MQDNDVCNLGAMGVIRTVDASLERYRRRLTSILGELDLAAVARIVDCLYDAWRRRAAVAIAGNGGSASTASHMANDLVKAAHFDGQHGLSVRSLVDNPSILTALANDIGYEAVFASQLDAFFGEGDVLVLISASGESPNVVAAARRARELGGSSIALLGFSGGTLAEIADITVVVATEHGEYGPVEDAHLALNHMISEALRERIAAERP